MGKYRFDLPDKVFQQVAWEIVRLKIGLKGLPILSRQQSKFFIATGPNNEQAAYLAYTIKKQDKLTDILDCRISSEVNWYLADKGRIVIIINVDLSESQQRKLKEQIHLQLTNNYPAGNILVLDAKSIAQTLDENLSIREKLAGKITAGNPFSPKQDYLKNFSADFAKALKKYLLVEFEGGRYARLDSAGQVSDQLVPLSAVFVDLPGAHTSDGNRANYDSDDLGIVRFLLDQGEGILRPPNPVVRFSRVAIVGGPGQGKSTVSQHLCQIYRAALLRELPKSELKEETKAALDSLEKESPEERIQLPATRRFPVLVSLNRYARTLASEPELGVLEYLGRQIETRTGCACSAEILGQWLQTYPWLIVFDGLDEVPASSNRNTVLQSIQTFSTNYKDLQIITTTRPQSYGGEFSEFDHIQLKPLASENALAYGKKLVSARWGHNPARKEEVLEKLRNVCGEEDTNRLMQSPLQVTIMVALIETAGDPPKERYRLFEQYYRKIYDRESAKEGDIGKILRERKTDIDILHYRAGLYLQRESERAGATDARISEATFETMVKDRLREVETPENELQAHAAAIVNTSIRRLVFLVRKEEGFVSFELRSLQEFMAGEAIWQGDEATVLKRISFISPYSHWRNVFLFIAGRCFADRQHLLDRLLEVCREQTESLFGLSRWGSRLALAILREGMADRHHRYRKLLLELARPLLRFFDVGTFRALADIYRDENQEIYKSQVDDFFASSKEAERYAGWLFLAELGEKRVSWASTRIKLGLGRNTDRRMIAGSLSGKQNLIEQLAPEITEFFVNGSPYDLKYILLIRSRTSRTYLRDFIEGEQDRFFPPWLLVAKDVVSDIRTLRVIPAAENSAVSLESIEFMSELDIWKHLAEAPSKHPDWRPLISAGRLAKKPTSQTLAKELRWLSESWNAKTEATKDSRNLPWPLAVCLKISKSRADLLNIAAQVQTGLFGTTEDWFSAENRWSKGVDLDLVFGPSEDMRDRLPWLLTQGFPDYFYLLTPEPEEASNLIKTLLEKYTAATGRKKRWLAKNIFQLFTGNRFLSIDASQIEALRSVVEDNIPNDAEIYLADVVNCFDERFSLEWIEFFEWFGRQNDLNLMLNPDWEPASVVAQASETKEAAVALQYFLESFQNNPNLLGILRILSHFSLAGFNCPLDPEILSLENYSTRDSKSRAAAIRFSQTDWSPQTAETLADSLAPYPEFIGGVCHVLESRPIPPISRDAFIQRLWNNISLDAIDNREQILETVINLLNRRRSILKDPGAWHSLRLPNFRKPPISDSDFEKVIRKGLFYVDKTLFIQDVLARETVLLIPRPRRFGKSLNLSMLRYFLEDHSPTRSGLFDGLAIQNEPSALRKQGKYPVIYLSFREVKADNFQSAIGKIGKEIAKEYARHRGKIREILEEYEKKKFENVLNDEAGQDSLEGTLERLLDWLHRAYRGEVVILIDEYDAPLHSAYEAGSEYYEKMVQFLRNLLVGPLKDNPKLFKGVLTGILRIARDSIFSGLNNLGVYTLLEPEFQDRFGFTETEFQKICDYYVVEDPATVRDWYNGYRFGGETIYNPFSILSYVYSQSRKLEPFWRNVSDDAFIRRLIVKRGTGFEFQTEKLLRGETITGKIRKNLVLRDLEHSQDAILSLLTFSGYLKPVGSFQKDDEEYYELAIPNKETASFYKESVKDWLSEKIGDPLIEDLTASLVNCDIKAFGGYLGDLVQKLSFHDTKKDSGPETVPERVYHVFTFALLLPLLGRYEIESNREHGYGLPDIFMKPRKSSDPGFIIEFKKAANETEAVVAKEMKDAIEQIQSRDYIADLQEAVVKRILGIGIVASGKKVWVDHIELGTESGSS